MKTSVNPVIAPQSAASGARRVRSSIRAVTYLAPKLLWFYQYISRYLEAKLQLPMSLAIGKCYEELPGRVDLAFICGLPYVEIARRDSSLFEPLVAPILQGNRYRGDPIYYSDVVVRRDTSLRSFADLRGCSWAYNEPRSQSGYGITRYHLVQNKETDGYFGSVVEAGFHERAIRMVCSGEVDASAIDSHVLAVMMRDEPALTANLRVIADLGPSTIQPLVAARRLPSRVKDEIRSVLLDMADDPVARPHMDQALVERFELVTDAHYDDIRRMLAVTESADYSILR